ncbi:MAG: hypothetical protein IT364_12065 [Candidatus Hydrogenedentes bacterium]|nr:hypothetical protein [Candidatus Hydrogenedentota bacterium]
MSQPPVFRSRPQPKKSGFPWLLVGCLGAIAVGVFLLIAAFIAARMVVGGLVDEYSDETPQEIPVSTMAPEDYAALKERFDAFTQAVNQGTPVAPLELTSDDVNALIQNDPNWSDLKGHVHVALEDDLVGSTVSMPLESFGMPGRYVNGNARFSVFLRGGQLYVHIESLEVGGKALPEAFVQGMRSENLAKEYNNDAQVQETLSKFESIDVVDGVLRFVPNHALQPEAEAGQVTEGAAP